jgi:hypothetical protein
MKAIEIGQTSSEMMMDHATFSTLSIVNKSYSINNITKEIGIPNNILSHKSPFEEILALASAFALWLR